MDGFALWSATLRADDRAFSEIFDTHQVRVVRHAAHLIAERCDAEDVAAVAFLELWRLRRQVRIVDGSVLPWLLVTTTNIARNTTRSFRRYNRLLRSLPRDHGVSTDPADAIESQLSSQKASLLEHAMESMGRTDSTLLILTAIEGLSAAEAARAIVSVVAVIAALALGGTAAATAGYIVLPGSPSAVALGKTIVGEHHGTATVDLGAPPTGATNIAVEFWCLTTGTFTLGDGSEVTCSAADIGSRSGATLPLAEGQHSTTVRTSVNASWRLSAAYVNSTTTPWAINGDGKSFGVANDHGTPDLIAVATTDGKCGYAFAKQIADADGSAAAAAFTSPQKALDWQKEMAGKRIIVPVYLSDGKTRIGDFVVSYPPNN